MAPPPIRLEAACPLWISDHAHAQLLLTCVNYTATTCTMYLPRPLNEKHEVFASYDQPTLMLVAEEPVTGNEEAFVLTDSDTANTPLCKCKPLTLRTPNKTA